MSDRNRNVWIIVVVVVVLLCCCAAAATATVALLMGMVPISMVSLGDGPAVRETLQETFTADGASVLKVDSFSGAITVRGAATDELRVLATKQAGRQSDLDRVQVRMTPTDGGFLIQTSRPGSVRNAWVNLEITVPRSTRLDLDTGSGSVKVFGIASEVRLHTASGSVEIGDVTGNLDIRSDSGSLQVEQLAGRLDAWTASGSIVLIDVQGEVDAHTNSGRVEARNATGKALLDTNSGSVRYQGVPEGDCRFSTKSGSITLRVPADLDATLDLSTSSGSVNHEFSVTGIVRRNMVDGIIGDGQGCRIYAHTPSGSIDLLAR